MIVAQWIARLITMSALEAQVPEQYSLCVAYLTSYSHCVRYKERASALATAMQVDVSSNHLTLQRFHIESVPSVYCVRDRNVLEYAGDGLSADAVRRLSAFVAGAGFDDCVARDCMRTRNLRQFS